MLGDDVEQRPELTEAETRRRIDEQLRRVGWEADTERLRHSRGTRPERGRRLAIAEWPTDSDVWRTRLCGLCLFIDTMLVGTIEAIHHLTRFCANLCQIHAFGEGNTRSTAVFMIKYLKTLGFIVTNDQFSTNSWYFRNALVRANYSNLKEGITETTLFLERFFRNMLLGETTPLRNREMHLDWKPETEDQSATDRPQSANVDFQSANCALLLP